MDKENNEPKMADCFVIGHESPTEIPAMDLNKSENEPPVGPLMGDIIPDSQEADDFDSQWDKWGKEWDSVGLKVESGEWKAESGEWRAAQAQKVDEIRKMCGDILDGTTQNHESVITSLQEIANRQDETKAKMTAVCERLEKVVAEQEATIRQQHETISRFQNDMLLKSQKDLIMELIGIADQIHYMRKDQMAEANYDKLLEDVRSLGEWVEASLNTAAVRSFVDEQEDRHTLDGRRQEVVDVEDTTDPALDGTFESELPGYIWSMPWLIVNSQTQLENLSAENARAKRFEFVLRPQQMVKLKLRNEK